MQLIHLFSEASLVAQMVKCLPAMQETWVRSLGREDSPGEGNGDPLQYSCLENSMNGEAWRATVHGVAKSWTQLSDFPFFSFSFTEISDGEEMATHSSILSCLGNPMDRGAWQATAYRVTKSQTRLKQLSKHEILEQPS